MFNEKYYIKFRHYSLALSVILLLWYFLNISLDEFPVLDFLPQSSEKFLSLIIVTLLLFFNSEILFFYEKNKKSFSKIDNIQITITITVTILTIVVIYPKLITSSFLHYTTRVDLIISVLIGALLALVTTIIVETARITFVFYKFRKKVLKPSIVEFSVLLIFIILLIFVNGFIYPSKNESIFIFRQALIAITFLILFYSFSPTEEICSEEKLNELTILSASLDRSVELHEYSAEHNLKSFKQGDKRQHHKVMKLIKNIEKLNLTKITINCELLADLDFSIVDEKLHVNSYPDDQDVISASFTDSENGNKLHIDYIKFKHINSVLNNINLKNINISKIETKEEEHKFINYVTYKALAIVREEKGDNKLAILAAVQDNNLEYIKYILKEKDLDINYQSPDNGYTALTLAIANGNYEISNYLLQKAANPNIANKLGITPLGFAARYGNKSLCNLLISYGAEINYQTPLDGTSPLMKAAESGHQEVVKLLLAKGASPKLKDKEGDTALDYATSGKFGGIAKLLRIG